MSCVDSLVVLWCLKKTLNANAHSITETSCHSLLGKAALLLNNLIVGRENCSPVHS